MSCQNERRSSVHETFVFRDDHCVFSDCCGCLFQVMVVMFV